MGFIWSVASLIVGMFYGFLRIFCLIGALFFGLITWAYVAGGGPWGVSLIIALVFALIGYIDHKIDNP